MGLGKWLSKKTIGRVTVLEGINDYRVDVDQKNIFVQKTTEFQNLLLSEDEKAIENYAYSKVNKKPARKDLRQYKRNMKKFMKKNKTNMKIINAADVAKVNELEGKTVTPLESQPVVEDNTKAEV